MSTFPHPSRPGFHGLTLPDELTAGLTCLLTAFLPGDGVYPSAAEAQVVHFIEQRMSEADLQLLRRIVAGRTLDSVEDGIAVVSQLEREDPAAFAELRQLAYHGYYASGRVLAAMADRGYAYHGAPQPLGYEITEEMALPSAERGSYVATGEVTRAAV